MISASRARSDRLGDGRGRGSDRSNDGRRGAVPVEQGLRGDEEDRPAQSRQQASGGRQEDAIGRPQIRPTDLAAQDRQLVAQDDDLKLLEVRRASSQRDQLDQPAQGEIEERDQQRRLLEVGDGAATLEAESSGWSWADIGFAHPTGSAL